MAAKRDPNKIRWRTWAGSADVYSDERGTIGRVRKLKDAIAAMATKLADVFESMRPAS